MQDRTWSQELAELLEAAATAFVGFWKRDMVQVGLTVLMFLALAVPLLLVILLLWYLDYTGWRPARGFYTIGISSESFVSQANLLAVGLSVFHAQASAAVNLHASETDLSRHIDS
jgi:hypothetical protein